MRALFVVLALGCAGETSSTTRGATDEPALPPPATTAPARVAERAEPTERPAAPSEARATVAAPPIATWDGGPVEHEAAPVPPIAPGAFRAVLTGERGPASLHACGHGHDDHHVGIPRACHDGTDWLSPDACLAHVRSIATFDVLDYDQRGYDDRDPIVERVAVAGTGPGASCSWRAEGISIGATHVADVVVTATDVERFDPRVRCEIVYGRTSLSRPIDPASLERVREISPVLVEGLAAAEETFTLHVDLDGDGTLDTLRNVLTAHPRPHHVLRSASLLVADVADTSTVVAIAISEWSPRTYGPAAIELLGPRDERWLGSEFAMPSQPVGLGCFDVDGDGRAEIGLLSATMDELTRDRASEQLVTFEDGHFVRIGPMLHTR